ESWPSPPPLVAISRSCQAIIGYTDVRAARPPDVLLSVAETVEEAAEYAALADEGGSRGRRDTALPGDGLVVVGSGDRMHHAGLIEVRGAFDLGHVANEHAIAHDLGFQASRAVGVPLGLPAAGQRHPDAELADSASEQVGVDTAVA